jgi:DhnA family fructose-bisphosphate aldolase class Ia
MSVQPRLNRLFGADGKCFDVAIDHGFFNEHSFLSSIENMPLVVATLVEAAPDAIQLSPGLARILQSRPGQKPALVLRTDVANVYGNELPRTLFSELVQGPVDLAVRLDAACVVVNVFMIPNQPEVHHQCLKNVAILKPLCEAAGMPLMVEPLVFQPNSTAGGYMVDGDLKKILPLVRQAVELGADIIKADPCDDAREYHKVIEIAAGIPVLVRGGGRVVDRVIFERTAELMRQGAAGIVYGRNVIQHPKPIAMTRALMAIVHHGVSVEEALGLMAV